MRYNKSIFAAVLGAATLFSTSAMAENHEVVASLTSFKPLVVNVELGDTVSWSRMSGHLVNTTFIDSDGEHQYIPEGAEGFMSQMSANFKTEPLTVEGVYLYKCDPHWGAGMGGAIIVGEPDDKFFELVESKPKGALGRVVRKTAKAIE